MAEEEKPKQLVQMSTVFASGITAIVAALFTSRLGVAGTLIGTALTPMLMTIGVAVLNAQIQKATEKIPDLPTVVRGGLSTQRVRVPGTPSPEEAPAEPEQPVASRRRDRRSPAIVERMLSIPAYLKEMSPSTRRRTLLTGVLAGLVATVIGFVGVTGIEAVAREPLSCIGREVCAAETSYADTSESPSTSIGSVFDRSTAPETQTQDFPAGSENLPADDLQQQDAQPAPDAQPVPEEQQYQGTPQGSDGQSAEEPAQEVPAEPAQQQQQPEQPPVQEDPSAVPQDESQQPSAAPGVEQQPATPPDQQQQ